MIVPSSVESPEPETPVPSLTVPVVISLVLSALLFAASGWAWQQLPMDARVPIHWNIEGKVDGYGGRGTLFLLPGMVLGLTLLFAVLPRIEPRRVNLMSSFKAYRAVWLAVLSLLGGVQILIVQAALGKKVPMDKCIYLGLGFMMLVMGNFLGKVRSNYVFGVRTPWTLSSELSWNKTHRLAGRMFVIYGLLMLLAAMVQIPGKYILMGDLAGLFGILLIVAGYSYRVWQQDPARSPIRKGGLSSK